MGLILDLDAIGTGALERAHGLSGIERLAESGVGIDDQRKAHSAPNSPRLLGNFGQPDQAPAGHAEAHVGHAGATDADRLEAEVLDQPGQAAD